MRRSLFLFLACVTLANGARADEIHLKDGSKIVGSIVGYEENAFKVETSYGFAMVRKDSIAEIIPGEAKKSVASTVLPVQPSEAAAREPVTVATAPALPTPAPKPAAGIVPPAQPAGTHVPDPVTVAAAATPAAPPLAIAPLELPRAPATRSKPTTPPVVKAASLPVAPDLLEPIAPAAPTPPGVQEFLRGNLYVNQTYGFEMFRPPGWELQQDATAAMPNAIAALGTSDETTLLVIGRDIARDAAKDTAGRGAARVAAQDAGRDHGANPLDARAASTERTLRGLYENYRVESSSPITVDGLPAVEEHARGVADGHDWSVVALTFGRENDIYTILGMTYADSDLIQIRENVLARMIASLHFLPPPAR
jgi:hypothetical protein